MNWLNLPAVKSAHGTIKLPGSKSISNRTLLLAALGQGSTQIHGLLVSDDTSRMLDALKALGIHITQSDDNSYCIKGCAGKFPVNYAELFLGNAGTAFRPLAAVLALMNGHYQLFGVARMHERPIAHLVDALRQLGANINYLENEGFPPLEIKPAQATNSMTNQITVKGNVSSQFLTGLLMALPLTGKESVINVDGILISQPYIALTLAQMARFGVEVTHSHKWQQFTIPARQHYQNPSDIQVEGDASSASYFLAAGALGAGPVRVQGVGRHSFQGDIQFTAALEKMGAQITMGDDWIEASAPIQSSRLNAIELDCNHIPDAAMTLVICALFADSVTTLKNIASWRQKETDRLAAMSTELRKLGATVEEGADYIRITPPPAGKITPNAAINTYDDHRMAMCFSLASFGAPIRINDPGCVAKTFPNYFEQFAQIVNTSS